MQFAEGVLPEKTKQLIAVAVAHVTQCPFCITGHTKLAGRKGASPEEIMKSIWVAAEMRAGGAFAHATLAINAMDRGDGHRHTMLTARHDERQPISATSTLAVDDLSFGSTALTL